MNDDVGLEVLPYEFEPSAVLLTDFWNEVDRILKKSGSVDTIYNYWQMGVLLSI